MTTALQTNGYTSNQFVEPGDMEYEVELKEATLEAKVESTFQGNILAPFEEVTDRITGGYEARCRRCDQTAWISVKGLLYSLLEERCRRGKNV